MIVLAYTLPDHGAVILLGGLGVFGLCAPTGAVRGTRNSSGQIAPAGIAGGAGLPGKTAAFCACFNTAGSSFSNNSKERLPLA